MSLAEIMGRRASRLQDTAGCPAVPAKNVSGLETWHINYHPKAADQSGSLRLADSKCLFFFPAPLFKKNYIKKKKKIKQGRELFGPLVVLNNPLW